MQDSSTLLSFCSVRAGRLPSAAQASPHQSAAVRHWLYVQPCLCHSGGGSDPGRHPQSHLLHAKVPSFIWSEDVPCPLSLLTPAPSCVSKESSVVCLAACSVGVFVTDSLTPQSFCSVATAEHGFTTLWPNMLDLSCRHSLMISSLTKRRLRYERLLQ